MMTQPLSRQPLEEQLAQGAASRLAVAILLLQSLYYTATGLWPIFSIRTFEMITGPKVDRWLVKTVGILTAAIAAALGAAGLRRRVAPETTVLAIGSAAAFVGVDVLYALRGRISKVYLVDAAGQLALIAGWLFAILRGSR